MRRIQVTREMAEWLGRKVSEGSGFLLQTVQGSDLVLRVLPKLEARATSDTDVMLELDDAEFDLLARASQPRTRVHNPQELMQEARCRAVFLRSPSAEVAALGPVATTAAPSSSPEVSGTVGHSGFGMGAQAYGAIANVPNMPPSMRSPAVPAPELAAPPVAVPGQGGSVTVLSPDQARAMGAKTAEELGMAPSPDDPLELERRRLEEAGGLDLGAVSAQLDQEEHDTTPPPPTPKTRIGLICVEILTRFGELAARVPEVLPPNAEYSSEARAAVIARRARLRELVEHTQNLGETGSDTEAAFKVAADFEQALLDNLAELEREERAVLEELNAAGAVERAPDTERPATGVQTVGIPTVQKL